ncbi:putative cell surface protein or serine/threonine protein kinase-like protein [Halobiforma lacisalsi AJ5]|nr:PQQ-binding-like beta-propeller repeat protein [Halobiforma lacisalsi]EMA36101.1 putative cell surface protein or serine/threonine protein kinase-like protein [Halobiforma lacisalsi AJ5]
MTGPGIDPTLDAVFAGSHDGNTYALDAETGEEAPRFETHWRIPNSPTIRADRLVFGSDDRTLYAVEKRTGEAVRHVDSDGQVSSTPLVHDGAISVAERAPAPPDPEAEDRDGSEIDTDGGGYKFVAADYRQPHFTCVSGRRTRTPL